jgi:hypothetical protein
MSCTCLVHVGVSPVSASVSTYYKVKNISTGVCIMCTFPMDSSATDCVAVVHQRISQLSSSGLMNITSHKFNRSDDMAYGCVEGVNLTGYQIGVIGAQLLIGVCTDFYSHNAILWYSRKLSRAKAFTDFAI